MPRGRADAYRSPAPGRRGVEAGRRPPTLGRVCGRYAATMELEDLVREMEIELDRHDEPARSLLKNPQDPPAGSVDHNMAPTKQAPVVLTRRAKGEDGGSDGDGGGDPLRQLRLLTWGLVPSWAKDTTVGMRMINARAESVLDKPAYAKAVAARRCLVPASGWYEWQASPTATDAKGKPRKQPFYIHRGDEDVVALAGLYEFWRDPAGAPDDPQAWLTTFAIITTGADPGMDRIHDRQPLVLEREDWARWLDPDVTEPDAVSDLLGFARPGRFAAHPVGRAVNTTANNGAYLLDPAPESDLVGVVDPETGEVLGEA